MYRDLVSLAGKQQTAVYYRPTKDEAYLFFPPLKREILSVIGGWVAKSEENQPLLPPVNFACGTSE